ncbi:MAG: nickel pincer cofactor biosynthesis protein LarB [Deltaproteobacteria bacterium]
MEKQKIISVLRQVKAKKITPEAAFQRLRNLPYEDMGFAKVDHHRAIRTGFPEVVFCQGKTPEQVLAICESLAKHNRSVLLTRCPPQVFTRIAKKYPSAEYSLLGRTVTIQRGKRKQTGLVSIVCAGTADIPVAEEAARTAEVFGCKVERHYDVGVAGIHRLLDRMQSIRKSKCIIAVAGMEGALASVIGGLASCPVIAVPTSIGYGASFKGMAALLTMLNCCAPGVCVVNIDNGFGAGYASAMINRGCR